MYPAWRACFPDQRCQGVARKDRGEGQKLAPASDCRYKALMPALSKLLHEFASENGFLGKKGSLSVALVVTRHAQDKQLPLDANTLLTAGGGQVSLLGKAAVQGILQSHGVLRVLAEEGGRTSRGSVGRMRKYVKFLNDLSETAPIDLEQVELWWVDRVKEFFAGKPFRIRIDPSNSLTALFGDLLEQASRRQDENRNVTYVGTLLQHLVGAKIEFAAGIEFRHHGASVADQSSGRAADFHRGDTAIHVTAAPGEAVVRKCIQNLGQGLRPVLIVPQRNMAVAIGLCEQMDVRGRVDVLAVEQFLASNLIEQGRFSNEGRLRILKTIITRYNKIVGSCETDPSLRIEMA